LQTNNQPLDDYRPIFVKGDLDSLRDDVREYYVSKGVPVSYDGDQDSTDLMKCVDELETIERDSSTQYELIILGGLSGRLDQTIHTLAYLHKLRKIRPKTYAVTDDNVGWVLDSGDHCIELEETFVGPACGLLPVGVSSTILSTSGLVWNLCDAVSSFDGLMSTSNVLKDKTVRVSTSEPIWWCVQLSEIS